MYEHDYNVEELKKAKLHPEEYRDLIVRVWGFSARFIDLCDDMQDHIMVADRPGLGTVL